VAIVNTPKYGRKKVDALLRIISNLAEDTKAEPNIHQVTMTLPSSDFLVLNDMLREMDRHLPDFFEDEDG
jgi:hypothetical protein